MPDDVIVADKLSEDATTKVCSIDNIQENDAIYDIGPQTTTQYCNLVADAGTILWNGPVGVFELTPFSQGTKAIAKAIANSQAFSIAGGGDTIAAINKFGIMDTISYISTGGGAFLQYIEQRSLPIIELLKQSQ